MLYPLSGFVDGAPTVDCSSEELGIDGEVNGEWAGPLEFPA
jgi:hypothetical protein